VKKPRTNPRTSQQTNTQATPQALVHLTTSLNQLRASSAPAEHISNDETLPVPSFPERDQTISTRSSCQSSVCADTTITIEPSRDLQAMQSVGTDIGSSSHNSAWRHSNRYLSRSQTSLIPEVYLPTGCPPWLAEDLRHTYCTPQSSVPSPRKVRTLEVKNWNQKSDWIEPTAPVYGPSPQDMDDLIERRRTWDEVQERKPRNPLKRIVSLSKELTGELKRKLSIGPTKKGFEPRLEQKDAPTRTKSEKQIVKTERPDIPQRSHTIGTPVVRRRLTKKISVAVREKRVQ
jgi:hypothetical protein